MTVLIVKKTCTACKRTQPITEFYPATKYTRRYKDGIRSQCKSCGRARARNSYRTPNGQAQRLRDKERLKRRNGYKKLPEKECRRCRVTKSAEDFAFCYNRKDGMSGDCKSCRNEYYKPYRLTPKYKIKLRDYMLKRNYGMTREDYNTLLDAQGSACAICNRVVELVVDHCHETNHVRGLLCNPCNGILGAWHDDPAIAENAKQYLLNERLSTHLLPPPSVVT